MNAKAIENRLRSVAAFAEAGSDMCDESDRAHAARLFEGAHHILANAKLLANAGVLLVALSNLLADYTEQYGILTDWQCGKTPGTPAFERARRLVKKLER